MNKIGFKETEAAEYIGMSRSFLRQDSKRSPDKRSEIQDLKFPRHENTLSITHLIFPGFTSLTRATLAGN